VDDLHRKYGDVVRIAPGEVAVADIAGVSQIHKIGSGFLKSNFYANLTPTREPGIFAMQNPHDHSARRKLFARAFSNSSMKGNWEAEIRHKTTLAVDQIRKGATQTGEGADVLKWWTLMATDVITHLSFGESFGMLEQGKVGLLHQTCSYVSHLTSIFSKRPTLMRCKQHCWAVYSVLSCPLYTRSSDSFPQEVRKRS
jgi:cytochrome P450